MSPKDIIQMIKNGGNPQQILLGVMQKNGGNNPVIQNLIGLAQKGDGEGIAKVARNMFNERGLDFDKEFNSFRSNLGI